MFKRVFLIVLDSVGVGNAEDCNQFDDTGANTIGNISNQVGLCLPNLEKMGLGNIGNFRTIKKNNHPLAYATFMQPKAAGKDSIAGHWELMGCILKEPFQNFCSHGFPNDLIQEFEKQTNKKILGNKEANGLKIIHELGEEHIKTKKIILYTSIDSTFQIAAHESVIPLNDLYKYCNIARQLTLSKNEWKVARVIARPFIGDKNNFTRTENRKDYAVNPFSKTVLDELNNNNFDVIGIGKINDLYNGNGINKYIKTKDNADGIEKIINLTKENFTGLAFLNLVDFDSVYGHPRDVLGYKNALEFFDTQLPKIIDNLHNDDLLIITADHGNDPTFKGNDHTRENVPLIVYSKKLKNITSLNSRKTFADVGTTIADNFHINFPVGNSFLNNLNASYLPLI